MTTCGRQSGKNRKVRDHIFNSKHEERETREKERIRDTEGERERKRQRHTEIAYKRELKVGKIYKNF